MIAKVLEHFGADLSHVREYGWQDIRCPFPENHSHGDRNKSARVNLEVGGFICMACGIKGDAIKLLMERDGMDYKSAFDYTNQVSPEGDGNLRRSTSRERPRAVSQWRTRLF